MTELTVFKICELDAPEKLSKIKNGGLHSQETSNTLHDSDFNKCNNHLHSKTEYVQILPFNNFINNPHILVWL